MNLGGRKCRCFSIYGTASESLCEFYEELMVILGGDNRRQNVKILKEKNIFVLFNRNTKEMEEKIESLEGGIAVDERGQLTFVNDLDMTEVRRFYTIRNADMEVIRAWHAHQHERKWYYVVKGAFTMAFVKIDNWENPSPDLVPEVYHLTEKESRILLVPEGYAGYVKEEEPDSVLLVFSSKILKEAVKDSWRYDKSMWMH